MRIISEGSHFPYRHKATESVNTKIHNSIFDGTQSFNMSVSFLRAGALNSFSTFNSYWIVLFLSGLLPVFFRIILAFLVLNADSQTKFPLTRRHELCMQTFLYCCSATSFSVNVGTDLMAVCTKCLPIPTRRSMRSIGKTTQSLIAESSRRCSGWMFSTGNWKKAKSNWCRLDFGPSCFHCNNFKHNSFINFLWTTSKLSTLNSEVRAT